MTHAPVSVVIPTFNRRVIVREAIDSVLAQSLPPAQIIVVDDGSVDGTSEALAGYQQRILYVKQQNAGLSSARNHGIRKATEPYVAFLDDDDVWHPRKLEFQMRCFERGPDIGLLGTEQFDWPAVEFPEVLEDSIVRIARITWAQLVVRTLIPVSSVVVQRDLIGRVGDFDVGLRSSEDRDFFLRIADAAPVGMLYASLIGYRDTPGSMCKNPAGREQAMRRILRGLDARDAWEGRWLLRRKAYSFMHHVCSDAHARAGNHAGSVLRVLKSLACYPVPYRPEEVRKRFERPKRLVVNSMRLLRLKSPDKASGLRPLPATNALDAARAVMAKHDGSLSPVN